MTTYPKAGDLQRAMASKLTGNPEPTTNPWEVRSDIGLEGVFANQDDAEAYADEIRRAGAKSVTAKRRERVMTPSRPAGAYHAPRGRPPGVPNPTWDEQTEDQRRGVRYDHDILRGMARALWVTSYADWVEGMTKAQRKRAGAPVSLVGIQWDDVAPAAPKEAFCAAQDLLRAYERENGTSMLKLFDRAIDADNVAGVSWPNANGTPQEASEDLADNFGHYLAMMAMGTGVSWFDDHAMFTLTQPNFEVHYFGTELEWSPHTTRHPPRGGER